MAATTLSGAILSLLGALGIAALPLFITFTLINLLATCVALHGLVFYLLYLFTGNRRLLGPLTVFHIAYYILLVSWSIIIWFLSGFFASISGLSQQDWWQIASRLIGLCAALAIMLAYRPTSWIKRRFGVTSIAEEGS